MALPFAVTAPAVLAGVAWLNAKTQFSYDLKLIRALVNAHVQIVRGERRDRVNAFYWLEQHATNKSTANHAFLVYQGRTWTYKEAYDIVLKYGTWLKTKHGVVPREVVAMDFMNSPVFVFLWLGIWSIGATPAFINYNLTGDPLLHSVRTSTARLLLVDQEVKPRFTKEVIDMLETAKARDGEGPVQIVFFDATLEEQIMDTEGLREPNSSRSAMRLDMAVLIFTSGTTGLPKPATVSWQKIGLLTGFMPPWFNLKKDDRYYTCMPLYHSSAALLGLCTAMVNGSTLVLGHRFSTATFWNEVRQHNATVIQYVGETCRYLLAAKPQYDPVTGENLDRVNKVTKAFGNGLRPDVWDRFKERFGIDTIGEFYGSTEGVSATWNLSSNKFSSGAIGRNGSLSSVIVKRQVAIVEVDWTTELPLRDPLNHNFCRQVKTGDSGELLFKVDPANIHSNFQGYFNNPSATESKIFRDVFVKGDAYCRSGDVVRWDGEGRWWFCDRIGDTFRWKSENVSTAEVSAVLGTHPRVHEANVYGVEVPNHDGRAGCAAVLFDTEDVSEALLDSVAVHARSSLPKYAVPPFLRIVKGYHTTGTNKQMKALLRAEGIAPEKTGGDEVYWLKGGKYERFGNREWEELSQGRVVL
ncbi:hypothetical protein IMSHALPRED_006216 [Imshaugia aleurites]|uniref:Very long-chain fatty acid transport protein n=1 Tax=Imshaugia aleurites TaxID=172621 RepID=A0A8H3IDX7_9LECA|nr:hypothetical protein IMSHALPRED_006216 [Imshaugia aleurites]